jgi:hypothetical protein
VVRFWLQWKCSDSILAESKLMYTALRIVLLIPNNAAFESLAKLCEDRLIRHPRKVLQF